MTEIITIRKPWFSAWQKFGWEKNVPGVGISKNLVLKAVADNGYLKIKIGKDPTVYKVYAGDILRFVVKHKTEFTARGETVLYVVPKTMLTEEQCQE